jgi:two-component sensor histidine kinase
MTLAEAYELAVLRRSFPQWLLGKRAFIQFAGIIILAVASLTLSAFVTERERQARLSVDHSREMQVAIDKVVWDLLDLQQATQVQRLDHPPDQEVSFVRIGNVRADVDAVIRLAADNPDHMPLLAELDQLSRRYLFNIDRLAAAPPGSSDDRDLVSLLAEEADQISLLIGRIRQDQVQLLESRTSWAETLFELLLPTLGISAIFITLLVVMAAKSINRVVRERDIWLLEKERELAAKDMMMREVDHRARNSLDLVYNLMTLQQQRPDHDDATRNVLAEAANQILVVSRVHDRLYRARIADRLPIADFLHQLCEDVAAYSLAQDQRALVRVQAVEAELPAEQTIWLGQIVVELVTNAIKYGNPSVERPILVDVTRRDKQLRIAVADSGAGLSEDFDPTASKGLGMQVVILLVKQLHGRLSIDRAWAGARFVVTVPLPPVHDRVAKTTAPSVKASAATCPAPSGSRRATADATTPMTGTAMVPIAATEAGRRASAANQLR